MSRENDTYVKYLSESNIFMRSYLHLSFKLIVLIPGYYVIDTNIANFRALR